MNDADRAGEDAAAPAPEPEPAIITGSREQLLHLLAEAAEIEHTLMCSYLYAAFSLKRRGEPGLCEAQGDAVERWRKAIMDVAIEEMGHLLIVANLTLAVGGRPHFARPNFPVAAGYFPAAVTVRLSGFGPDTLDHFIFLERPQGMAGEDAPAYDQADYERGQAVHGLMPAMQDYATIGHLYDAIRGNIRALAGALGEEGLFIGDTAGQLGPEAVDMAGVTAIHGVEAAMAAIDVIVEQGEGSTTDQEDSHYRSFLAVRDELERLSAEDAGFAPAWPVADDPVLRAPPEPGGTCFIDHAETARLLDWSCAVYGLLLRTLVQSFGRTGATAADDRSALLGIAFTLMHVLAAASDALARAPASPARLGVNAGMTFTMLRGVEPLLGGMVEQTLLRERLVSLAMAARSLPPLGASTAAELVKLAEGLHLGPL